MTRVLLTGLAGFIGSHVAEHLQAETDWDIVGLASFRHRGDPLRLTALTPDRVTVYHADLTAPLSPRLVERIGPVDYVLNLAAESHVDRSIEEPRQFMENNVSLAVTMLDYARLVRPRVFVQISTDEVYGPAPAGTLHDEWSPIIPSNPYSASKAAQEAVAIAYWRTYGVPVVITNTMNNFGERQDAEKMIPKTIRSVLAGEVMPIHGTPAHIGSRFYLHARSHADALLFILTRPPMAYPESDRPDRYNVVGDEEIDNLELAQRLAALVGKPLLHEFVDWHSARPGHDPRYALSGTRLAALGWHAPEGLDDSLRRVVEWTLNHREWLRI